MILLILARFPAEAPTRLPCLKTVEQHGVLEEVIMVNWAMVILHEYLGQRYGKSNFHVNDLPILCQ